MYDERKIEGRSRYGKQYDVGNIALYVTTESWGGRWHEPTIQLSATGEVKEDSPVEVKYTALASLSMVFRKAEIEWERLDDWRRSKNSQKIRDSV